jgi:hypothetical protein
MKTFANIRALGLLSSTLFLIVGETRSAVLDWDTVSWTPNGLTATYVDVNGSGVDMTVTISGDTGTLASQLSNTLTGGLNPPQNSLLLAVDWASKSETITVTVTFSELVNNVSYNLFSVDRGDNVGGGIRTYVDQISTLTATDGNTTYAASITAGAHNAIEGTGINQTIYGSGGPNPPDDSGKGNTTISYGTNPVNSLTFTYGNRSDSQSNPAAQAIALHDINFTVVPEVPAGAGSAMLCLVGILAHQKRKKGA